MFKISVQQENGLASPITATSSSVLKMHAFSHIQFTLTFSPHHFLCCPADGAGVFPNTGILTSSLSWASRSPKIQKRVPGEDVQSTGCLFI